MKKIFFFIVAFAACKTSFAQSRLTTAEYQKTNQPAIEMDVPFPEKTVSKSIDEYFQKIGYKGKDTKGYLTYKGVRLPQLGSDSYDLYFKTDKKSKREKDATTVILLISSGYEKFIGDTTNARLIDSAKNYMNGLTERVAAYDLDQQINEQDDAVKKASKKMSGLSSDAEDLQKKKLKIENDIAENLKQQQNAKAESEKQLQILNTLKDKRKQ
jgi:hypothetical protein